MNVYLAEFVSLLLVINAIAIIRVANLFVLVLLLSVYSALLSVMFALLGAVDVSFTEAVVGTGVSTVLMMALIWRIDPSQVAKTETKLKLFGATASCLVFAVLVFMIDALPVFGNPNSAGQSHIAPEYISSSMKLMHTPNVVTAVLADFRGFDTLIETVVVLTGALACLLILGKKDDSSV